MSDTVRIYPEITREHYEKLKEIATKEHRKLQDQVGYILDKFLSGELVEKEAKA